MARKFLYFVAIVIFLVIAGAFALNIWSKEATELGYAAHTLYARAMEKRERAIAEETNPANTGWYQKFEKLAKLLADMEPATP